MKRLTTLVIVESLLLLGLAACAHTGANTMVFDVGSLARNRAAIDFHCAQDKITVSKVGGGLGPNSASVESYGAVGCGQSAFYRCEDKASWYQSADYWCERATSAPKKG